MKSRGKASNYYMATYKMSYGETTMHSNVEGWSSSSNKEDDYHNTRARYFYYKI